MYINATQGGLVEIMHCLLTILVVTIEKMF
jgi:hypothetical protein